MVGMRGATYTGDDPLLKGHRALVRWPTDAVASPAAVLVQFETVTMNGITRRPGDLAPFELPVGTERYLYGWHEFAEADFSIDMEV